ncbi:hypothetical protein BH23ACT9_BH23ACT9_15220 [soil metagenome]
MAGLTPRRLAGRTLTFSARAGRLPLLGAGVRAAGRPLLGLDRLRDARLGETVPYLTPPPGPALPQRDRADAAG